MHSGSNDSLYKSAGSDDDTEGALDSGDFFNLYTGLKRPPYLSGTSSSSLVGDDLRSEMESRLSNSFLSGFTSKFNNGLLQTLKLRYFSQEEGLNKTQSLGSHRSCQIEVKILGYEVIEHRKKFTVILHRIPHKPAPC